MNFRRSTEAYLRDMQTQGRINSEATVRSYRAVLLLHAEDVGNSDPRYVGRRQVKETLARWTNPNTQRLRLAILRSFYDWTMEEGIRKDNPARQVRRPKRRPTQVYRLTLEEVERLLRAAAAGRERRAIYLGICAGLRNQELRGMQGRHFSRPGFVWVSADIAKGSRERWVPVIEELEPVIAEIQEHVEHDAYVLPAQRFSDPGVNRIKQEYDRRPSSAQALYYLVKRVGERAGIAASIHPHLLRHAFGDHMARHVGLERARALMGHATAETTRVYMGQPTLDELTEAVKGFAFGVQDERMFQGVEEYLANPDKATTGIEPVIELLRLVLRDRAPDRRNPER